MTQFKSNGIATSSSATSIVASFATSDLRNATGSMEIASSSPTFQWEGSIFPGSKETRSTKPCTLGGGEARVAHGWSSLASEVEAWSEDQLENPLNGWLLQSIKLITTTWNIAVFQKLFDFFYVHWKVFLFAIKHPGNELNNKEIISLTLVFVETSEMISLCSMCWH